VTKKEGTHDAVETAIDLSKKSSATHTWGEIIGRHPGRIKGWADETVPAEPPCAPCSQDESAPEESLAEHV